MPDTRQALATRAPGPRGPFGRPRSLERRDGESSRPWLLVRGGALGGGRFTAVHQVTGRSIRLAAGSVAQAEVQVELLNRRALEITA
jgi:hypothetical protein